ncbi:MAG: T9SS type A sorting domain-containing protein [Bacteroidota bacterium]
MKKGLLFILLVGLLTQLQGQDVVWSEDFSNGLSGWTVSTSVCDGYSGGIIGEWTLSRATVNGSDLTGVTGYFSAGTDEDYLAYIKTPSEEGQVQGKYQLQGATFVSNLNDVTLDPAGFTEFTTNNDTATLAFANLTMPNNSIDIYQTALGVGSPTYSINGNVLSITAGGNSFEFQRTSNCGALWRWSKLGWAGKAALVGNNVVMNSATGNTGTAEINGDWLMSKGVRANLPPTLPYPEFISELISPSIDLSNQTTPLQLTFTQQLAVLNPADDAPRDASNDPLLTSVSWSADGGQTWSVPESTSDFLPLGTIFNFSDTIPLGSEILGQSDVKIKVTYAGDFYYLTVDDIAITQRPAYNLRVNRDFVGYYYNSVTPISQLDGAYYWADAVNEGSLQTDDVELSFNIVNSQTGQEVFSSSIQEGSMLPDNNNLNSLLPDFMEPEVLNSVADYVATYSINFSNGVDALPADNSEQFLIAVRDSVFARDVGSFSTNVAPGDEPSFTYGNCYYVPNGEGFFARTMSFAVANADQLADRSVTILLYEWEGDTNGNVEADPEEYGEAPVAFNSYTFDGTESESLITVPIDLTGQGIALKDDRFYIVMVQYFTEDDQSMFMLANDDQDYFASAFVADSLDRNRYFAMLEVGQADQPSFSATGFGWGIVPVVRLHIGDNGDLSMPAFANSTPTEEILSDENKIELFPNPVVDQVRVTIDLVDRSERVQVMIMDLAGRILQNNEYSDLQTAQFDYNVRQLPAGNYLLQVRTDEGIKTQKFVVK